MAPAQKQAKTQVRAQARAPESQVIVGGDDPDEKFDAFADEDATLHKIFAELDQDEGASWLVSVHSIPATGGKAEYLFQCDPSQLEGLKDRLRDEFGSGTYIARVKRNGQVRGVIWFRIRAQGARAAQPHSDMQQVLAALKEQNAALLLLAQRALQPAPAPAPAATSLKELVETMVSLRALTAEGQGQSGVNLILEGIKLAKEVSSGDREPGILEMLLQSPVVQKLMEAPAMAGLTQPALPVPARPAAASIPAAKPVPPAADPFLQHLRFLCERAQANNDPQPYAYMILDVIPEPALKPLLEAGRGAVAMLERAVPEIGRHREWFGELVDNLAQIVADEAGLPGTEDDRAPGETPSPSSSTATAG